MTNRLFSPYIDFLILDISCKLNQTGYGLHLLVILSVTKSMILVRSGVNIVMPTLFLFTECVVYPYPSFMYNLNLLNLLEEKCL